MKRRKIIAIILLVSLGGFGWCAWQILRDHNKAYFAEQSGIWLPWGLTNVAHSNEFEFALTSHYTLPKEEVPTFIQRNSLSQRPPADWEPIFRPEYLPSPWSKVPTTGTLYYATGATKISAWDLLLDSASGELWTAVYFADYSGDLPPRVTP